MKTIFCAVLLGFAWAAAIIGPASAAAQTNQALAGSVSCRDCHARFYKLWSTSFHGLAMQPFTRALAQAQLTPQTADIVAGTNHFRADLQRNVVIERNAVRTNEYPIVQAMGGKNVYYFLTPLERGWLQVLPVAYDVRQREWFDTTASAMRHFGDHPDGILYWKERPLTFNTSCYGCHVSQLTNSYDLASDSYHTTWAEPGINCETCHGPAAGHVTLFQNWPTNQPPPADLKLLVYGKLTTEQINDACAACHAKTAPVTLNFAPGDRFFDHFDLIAFENPDFYPDGRDLGENYTFTQWRQSPCVKAGGLDCLHCHTSSGRYRFKDPAEANNACLPCHESLVRNETAHTHHQADSAGNACISCHMPMTEFARMRRSDHSMRPPTPAATIRYQSPNACNLCHTNQTAAWADKYVHAWYPRDYQKPVLEHAALIADARRQDWRQLPAMLAQLADTNREEVFSVSLIRLLANGNDPRVSPALRQLADHPSPWIRASVAEALGDNLDATNIAALLKFTADPNRLVRIRAASALANLNEEQLPTENRPALHAAVAEYLDTMRARPDDMASHYNLGNVYLARGEMPAAVAEFVTASRLQPEALPPYVNAALAYNALGQNEKAEASLRQALELDPTNYSANLNLGMLLAELGKMPAAEQAFRAAFKANTNSAQAAYNLGVMLYPNNPGEALTWCQRAAELGCDNPRYGYTYAFYLFQSGRTDAALAAIRPVREHFPADADSLRLEQTLLHSQPQPRPATNGP